MRDLNYLCTNQESIIDDDLLNIQLDYGDEMLPVLEELQYLRNVREALQDEIHGLQDELEGIRSFVKGDER